MDVQKYYSSLPYDLAGSRSKNRFRLELLWGVSVMLDLMRGDKDFTIVFDYVCDVEIHYEDSLEFHQVKTHEANSPSYTSISLTKKKTTKSGNSILGKLYALKKEGDCNVKLVLVSNVSLKIGNQKCVYGEFCLSALPEIDKQYIESALKDELGVSQVELSRIFFVHTHMNLLDPDLEIKGKLLNHYIEVKHCEPRNPNALFRLIFATVRSKACYEYSQKEYESILEKKGISRTEFSKMLDIHADNENNGIQQAKEYIDKIEDISKSRRCQQALARLVEQIPMSKPLQILEREIEVYLQSNETGSIAMALPLLNEKFGDRFPIEYTQEEKEIFFVITIGRFKKGGFDHGNGI